MVATVLVLALLAGIKGLSLFDEWLERRQTVKASATAAAHVLSSEPPQPAPKLVSGTGINPVSIPPAAPDRDIVAALAAIKTVDGYRFSANAIYGFVRGNRNEVLAWVREVRGDEDVYLGLPPDPHIQVPAYEPPPVSAR